MTSIETYRTRIDALKTSIETLKDGGPLIIRDLPGKADIVVRKCADLRLPYGTVIAGDGDHVYLRAPHGDVYWASARTGFGEPDGYSLEQFHDHLCEQAADGEQFRIVYQPDA